MTPRLDQDHPKATIFFSPQKNNVTSTFHPTEAHTLKGSEFRPGPSSVTTISRCPVGCSQVGLK